MIQLAVLDMAGTTVEDGDAVTKCFTAALNAAGAHAEPSAVAKVMGLPKPEAVRILLEQGGRPSTPQDVAPVHADFKQRMIAFYRDDPSARALPGAADAIAKLRAAGIKVALNTGFSTDIVAVLLARLGWTVPEVIDGYVCSDQTERGRPHPDMIQHLMKHFGISDPKTVAKVGDTESDLGEGTSADCSLVIGVTSGAYTAEELRPHPHTHIVGTITEAVEIILKAARA